MERSSLPKTMSKALIGKLNDACSIFSQVCDMECDNIGWCDACWVAAAASRADGECPPPESMRATD